MAKVQNEIGGGSNVAIDDDNDDLIEFKLI